jgi:hypothetical protein
MALLGADARVIEERFQQSLVISLECDIIAGKWVTRQTLDHAAGTWTAIDVIAERHREVIAPVVLGISILCSDSKRPSYPR